MSEKPVAWMTPGGDVSRSLEWCKERCWPEGEHPTPLYSQSPVEARALAIAEAAQVCSEIAALSKENESEWTAKGALICETTIRALSSPPSVSEEWVQRCLVKAKRDAAWSVEDGIREALAALGVTVEGAAK